MAVVTITKDNFETEVLGCKIPVVLDFWAEWCAEIQTDHPERVGGICIPIKIQRSTSGSAYYKG